MNVYDQEEFNNIWLTIPTISGDTPCPDFEVNQAVVILTEITVYSGLEVMNFDRCQYAMIEFERGNKPVSVLFKEKNGYNAIVY
ncbi:hypothetical protein ACJJIK_18490 [Microbulbifer sp. ZKSA006]|uniref:hypothetical protein n=1 Tax=Microbulbifer sp. ZKSA006 TaxID=3243390 RepID=UPI0040395A34